MRRFRVWRMRDSRLPSDGSRQTIYGRATARRAFGPERWKPCFGEARRLCCLSKGGQRPRKGLLPVAVSAANR